MDSKEKTIKVNFTEEEIQTLQDFLYDDLSREMKLPVFQWTIDGVLVNITVGEDEVI